MDSPSEHCDDALVEYGFACPYCWERITMLVDPTVPDQRYVEDCEVCCNPIEVRARVERGAVIDFEAQQLR